MKRAPFITALGIAIAVHLFLIFGVTIVVVPSNIRVSRAWSVSFLGPILEKTAFEMMVGQHKSADVLTRGEPLHFDKVFIPDLRRDIIALTTVRFEGSSITPQMNGLSVARKSIFGDSKCVPLAMKRPGSFFQEKTFRPRAADRREDEYMIEGALASREIISRPEAPVIARLIPREHGKFITRLKVAVLPQGVVDRADLLVSCGDPYVDLTAIAYVKRFRFTVDLSPGRAAAVDGVITVKLKGG